MALRPSQHAPSRLSTGVTRKRPRSGAFKEGARAMECCSEGALCGPGRPQSAHANTHRQGTVVFGIQKVRSTRPLHRPACCLQSPAVVESAADACLDPSIDKSPQCAPSLFAQQTNNCNKLCPPSLFAQQTNTATNSVQWTLQLLVSDARTECTGSLIRGRPARRGYRFALFSDAQGTPSLRIRVGQRGQGTRTSAARRGSVVAAASITQKHRRLVAR